MRRTAVVLLVTALAACGGGGEQPALSGAPTTTATTTTLPSVEALPERGIVGDDGAGVSFWSLDGELLDELPGLTLSSFTQPGGPVYVYRFEPPSTYSDTWRVEPDGSLTIAEGLVDGPAVWPDLPPPPGPAPDAGHWRWVLDGAVGDVRLGQWSGECEVPAAFFIDPDGTTRSVLGGDWTSEPTTVAMGWLPDGRALVDVRGESGCGASSPEPGRYAIDPLTGEREPVDLPSGVIWGLP